MQINSHLDPQLVDKIVHEVKSQGVFDEFRKNSMADVDTKPAYQNLRQRVETTVKRFLSEQKWSPEINKNQLRERLRKHITDSGFLDVGVERIVDQVVNPKIGTVFQPKIEDIAYKYLGVPKPLKMEVYPILQQLPTFSVNGNSLKIETSHLLPNDLEQVSPDSDKATVKSECKDECMAPEFEIKTDEDDESPPFEPLENIVVTPIKQEVYDSEKITHAVQKESVVLEANTICLENKLDMDSETQDTSSVSQKTDEPDSDKDANHNVDVFQESHSQLSQVSSTSCLSTETRDNNNVSREFNTKSHENAVNISEEAQMPRFSENSNEGNVSKGENNELHFDIKQDEIKFEGTKRNVNLQRSDIASLTSDCTNKDGYIDEQIKESVPTTPTELGIFQKKDTSSNDLSFKFTKIYVETKVEHPVKEKSSSASLDDSGTAQLCIVDKSENTQISGLEFNPTFDQRSRDKETEAIESHDPPPPFSTLDSSFSEKRDINECDREEGITSVSLSSSRHKKHSKQKKSEKYRYRDKEAEKEKDKHRQREKSGHRREKSPASMSKKSSTSFKNDHLSSKPLSSGNKSSDLYYRKSSNISHHTAKHSSCSSRSKSRDEIKRNERDFDKRYQQASSSSSSSHKKSEKDKKAKNQNDDHYASKDKIYWRKSTDSNDEDKKPDRICGKSNYNCTDSTKTASGESGGKYKNENNNAVAPSSLNTAQFKNAGKSDVGTACNDEPENVLSKIVILNEILENPSTDFIELSVAPQHNRMHVVRCEEKSEEMKVGEENSDIALYFFEQNAGQFIQRLKLIDNAIDRCRKVVNCLRFDSVSPTLTDFSNNFSDMTNTSRSYFIPSGTKRNSISETRATLHIDCIQYSKTPLSRIDFEEKIDNKRFKFMQSATNMVSPTLSDTSVNSKENEFIAADVSEDISKCVKNSVSLVEKRSSTSNKISQQRYTHDDLYKPIMLLGQRSRR